MPSSYPITPVLELLIKLLTREKTRIIIIPDTNKFFQSKFSNLNTYQYYKKKFNFSSNIEKLNCVKWVMSETNGQEVMRVIYFS